MKRIIAAVLALMLCLGAVDAMAATVAVKSVKLNVVKMGLYVGYGAQINATISPSNASNKTITWTTSNKNVAVVSKSGYVTATGVGTATITAKTNNGKTAKATVTVSQKPIAVSSIKITTGNISITVGQTQQLKVKVIPSDASNYSISWSSSNTKVATVKNGVVTAKAKGTANITAKTNNGKTNTVKVTVKNPEMGGIKVSVDGVVSWNKVRGADYYEVEWGESWKLLGWQKPVKVNGTSYAVPESKLKAGKEYTFHVRAYYNNGKSKTGWSSKVRRTICAGKPTVNVVKQTNQIVVSWSRPRFAKLYNVTVIMDGRKIYNDRWNELGRNQLIIPSRELYVSNISTLKVEVYAYPESPNRRYGSTGVWSK